MHNPLHFPRFIYFAVERSYLLAVGLAPTPNETVTHKLDAHTAETGIQACSSVAGHSGLFPPSGNPGKMGFCFLDSRLREHHTLGLACHGRGELLSRLK